jgi:hypothetical protein
MFTASVPHADNEPGTKRQQQTNGDESHDHTQLQPI